MKIVHGSVQHCIGDIQAGFTQHGPYSRDAQILPFHLASCSQHGHLHAGYAADMRYPMTVGAQQPESQKELQTAFDSTEAYTQAFCIFAYTWSLR